MNRFNRTQLLPQPRSKINSTQSRAGNQQVSLLLTWRKGLLELLSLFFVCDDQGVQVPAAAHLELNVVLVLLDLYG